MKEIISACRLLGILLKHPHDNTGDDERQIFNEGKGLLTKQDKKFAMGLNNHRRLDAKINQVFKMFLVEYVEFFGGMLLDQDSDEHDDS